MKGFVRPLIRIAGWAILAAAPCGGAYAQDPPVETLWHCKEKDGRTILTNEKKDTVGKDILLTNQHVVSSCSRIQTGPNGVALQVIASDRILDLAARRTTANFPDFARISSADDVTLGQDIVVAGFPLPGLLSRDLKLTTGTVSAVAGLRNDTGTYQITAPIQPGNSGGPVFDGSGSVIGVVVGKLNEIALASMPGSLPQNVNFAVSLKAVRRFLQNNEILTSGADGKVRRTVSDIAASAKRYTVPITCAR